MSMLGAKSMQLAINICLLGSKSVIYSKKIAYQRPANLPKILGYNLNFKRKACRSLDAFELMVSWHHHDATQSHRYSVKQQG